MTESDRQQKAIKPIQGKRSASWAIGHSDGWFARAALSEEGERMAGKLIAQEAKLKAELEQAYLDLAITKAELELLENEPR